MRPDFLAVLPVTAPVAVGIGVAALVGLYLAFKVGKFVLKLLLAVVVLAALGLAAWWYLAAHHG
jgi:hypothetical protein